MALLNNPPNSEPVVDEGSLKIKTSWSNFVMQLFRAAHSVYESGTTAQRPTTQLWVGRTYFDTTLNRPIWYVGPGWIKADGTAA
jgi:hypothetical protein